VGWKWNFHNENDHGTNSRKQKHREASLEAINFTFAIITLKSLKVTSIN
jgi:hypothetical protein